jgi:zinc protease
MIFKKCCFRFLPAACLLILSAAPARSETSLSKLESKRLLNDLQITVATTAEASDRAAVGLVVRYGSAFDPVDKGGVAHLLSRMFLKKTADRSAEDIRAELEILGARVEVRCDWDGIRFLLTAHPSGLERALLLLYQVVGEAEFEEDDFEQVRRSLLEELERQPDPRRRIHAQMEGALFGGTTYGRPLTGTPESVAALALGDVRFFYRKFFSPGQAALEIVGPVDPGPLLERATRIWGIWVRKDDVPFTFAQPSRPAGRRILVEDDPGSPAAQFIAGGLFPRREDAEYVHALMAARILEGRLNRILPTSLLTVGSEGRRLASPFYIQGQAAAEQAVGEIVQILDAVEEMKTGEVTPEELGAARADLADDFRRQLGSPEGLAHILMDAELYRLGRNYPAYFLDRIARCDGDAVRRAAGDWIFSGGELLLIRGPLDALGTRLSVLGPFEPLIP